MPTWPSSDVLMQVHLDLWVDDLEQAGAPDRAVANTAIPGRSATA
jgi:hypothetical protein